ncbi:hypothetical protein RKD18_006897 [Streptomyces phaeoluteigriseus]
MPRLYGASKSQIRNSRKAISGGEQARQDQLPGGAADLEREDHADGDDGPGEEPEPHHAGHGRPGRAGPVVAGLVGGGHLVQERLIGLCLEVGRGLVVGEVDTEPFEQFVPALGHLALVRHGLPLGGDDVRDVGVDVLPDAVADIGRVDAYPLRDLVQ